MELKKGRANLLRGIESVGGQLILEGRHLRFEPHEVNVQGRPEVLEVVDIRRIDRTWTKAFGAIPLAPNAMRVVMFNGDTFTFTVTGRKAWIEALSASHADTPKR